ncbi:MAG: prolipoprotein diacylglyceryl transferase [bacterium]
MNINFLHYFQPQPILFSIGPVTIRWYGFFLVLAFMIAFLVLSKIIDKKIPREAIYDLVFYLVIGGLLGARLYEVFILDWWYYQNNLTEIWQIWHGGLAIHGGIIGGLIALIWWSAKKKINFWLTLGTVAIVLPLGQAIGRWGNYFNQELFGQPISGWWGIPIEVANRPLVYMGKNYFQPVFLFESILNLILFFVLLFLFKKQKSGKFLVAIYLFGYGLIRFLLEYIRIDETLVFGWWRYPQWASVVMMVVAVILLIINIGSKNQKDKI